MTGTSWRDHIKVHPAAAMFPMMSDAELVALGEDIKKNGLRQPIVFRIEHRRQEAAVSAVGGQISNQMEVLQQAAEGKLLLLDGRNRLDAMEAVGILDDGRVQKLLRGAKINWADEGSAEEFVISANIHRRHLTHEKKRALIAALLKAKPERSDRETAKIAKVDHKTVAAVRTEVEGRGEIPHVEARTDTKGRQQPSTKQPKASSKEAQIRAIRESLATAPIRPISQSGQAYYGPRDQERDKAADELVQVLSGDPGRIAQIPRAQRVALAKSCLKLLQVSIDDLRPKIGGTASLTNTAKAPGACAVQCDWSGVAQAIEEERSPPGGRDASDAPRDRQHAFGEAEPPLTGPAFPPSVEASSTLLRTLNTIEASVDSGSAVDAVNPTSAKEVEPPPADDAGLFAIWRNLKPNTQKSGRRWIADGCPEKFHPGEHHRIIDALKPFCMAAAKASAAQRKRFLELSRSYEVVS